MEINLYYRVVRYFFSIAFRELWAGELYGHENIPSSGPCLIAVNHASFLDPPFMAAVCPQREIFYFARQTLFKAGFLNFILSRINTIPIDRDSTSDIRAIRRVLKLLHNGQGITIFPEGTRSSDGHFQKVQPGVGLLACKTSAPVIPVRIFGTYDIWNRHRSTPSLQHRAQVVIGTPLLSKDYDPGQEHSRRYLESAQRILNAIQKLQLPPLQRR